MYAGLFGRENRLKSENLEHSVNRQDQASDDRWDCLQVEPRDNGVGCYSNAAITSCACDFCPAILEHLNALQTSHATAAKMATHRADAKQMLDDRGYTGSLIRGQNPALLMEKAVRDRITDSYYWKEQCFGLNEATLCDRAVDVTYIGGVTGTSQKPTPFLCLAFKLLQLCPERAIILEYLNNEDFKYALPLNLI